ncbi:MAG TPA: AAA family ATPase, partial [Solirubrobacterales bacterium]|nr:AAA family ATPase [Solirubrobacterales bacterium]
MEEVVPERSVDEYDEALPPAGPVAEDDPSAHPPMGSPSTPPTGEALVDSDEGPDVVVAEVEEPEAAVEEPEGDGRLMARDLIAPSRHEVAVEEPAAEVPTKHAEVIAFANQKGGVAKTTTTLNLAVAFAESGHRVLCIDMDPQGNLTMSQGIDPDKVEKSLYDVLVNDMPISEIIQRR